MTTTPNNEGYTEEPWRIECANESAGAWWIAAEKPSGNEVKGADDPFYKGILIAESVCRPNAERIIACVNACRGFSSMSLEGVALGELTMIIGPKEGDA